MNEYRQVMLKALGLDGKIVGSTKMMEEKEDEKYNFKFNLDEIHRVQKTLRWCIQSFRSVLSFLQFMKKINKNETLFGHSVYGEIDEGCGMLSEELIKECKEHFNEIRKNKKSETFHGLYTLLETKYEIMDVVGMIVQNMSHRNNRDRLDAI